MIFVDTGLLRISDQWYADADAATALLINAATNDQRRLILRSKQRLWSDVKDDLAALSNGKCWYCEVAQVRSYMVVDHFRPKNRVRGVNPAHEGYWWLAFDVDNYRFACSFCNSPARDEFGIVRGKQDYFPIEDEATRVRSREVSTDTEVVMLLDPTKSYDPPLLFFDPDGHVRPNPRLCTPGSLRLKRAELTIEMLNLNHPGVRDRRKRLGRALSREVRRARRCWPDFVSETQPGCKDFEEACDVLKQAMQDFTELAGTARAYVRAHRESDQIVQELLEAIG